MNFAEDKFCHLGTKFYVQKSEIKYYVKVLENNVQSKSKEHRKKRQTALSKLNNIYNNSDSMSGN